MNLKENKYMELIKSKSTFNPMEEYKKSTLKSKINKLKNELKKLNEISKNNREASKRRLHNLIHK